MYTNIELDYRHHGMRTQCLANLHEFCVNNPDYMLPFDSKKDEIAALIWDETSLANHFFSVVCLVIRPFKAEIASVSLIIKFNINFP